MPRIDITDVEYEKLVANIHQAIIKMEGTSSVTVEHDKKLQGRSGQIHQIDVYWKYTLGGSVYQTAIECRNYSNNIPVGKIRDFFGLITDIGNISGIMVTTVGYGIGAKKLADHYGIKLSIIRSVTDIDLSGFINTIVINMTAVSRRAIKWNIAVPRVWSDKHIAGEVESVQLRGMNNEVGIFDSQGKLVKSFFDIENSLPDTKDGVLLDNETHNLVVDVKDNYLKDPTYGLIPIESFSVDYVIHRHNIVSTIVDPHPTNFVFENFGEVGETLHIHKSDDSLLIKKLPKDDGVDTELP